MEVPATQTTYHEFWQKGAFLAFSGINGKRIEYAEFTHQQPCQDLIIVPGRCEGYLKYQEVAFELFQQGYNIYIIDHRGQGLSERLTENPHKGFVENFDDYCEDLAYFITNIVSNKRLDSTGPYVIAHSMGGAITIRLLQKHSKLLSAAVLCSPMIAINRGKIPKWFAKILITAGCWINRLLSKSPWYFFGQADYLATPFVENKLTHDKQRYLSFVELYKAEPQLQLGGVTFHWLAQAIKANEIIFADMDKIITPLYMIQAGCDEIVDNTEQDKFCQLLHQRKPEVCPQSKPLTIEGAHHELLFEQDRFREPTIKAILNWLNELSLNNDSN
ncbi:alpha/beta fold hydrolase [Thalassotalea ganghwensis]